MLVQIQGAWLASGTQLRLFFSPSWWNLHSWIIKVTETLSLWESLAPVQVCDQTWPKCQKRETFKTGTLARHGLSCLLLERCLKPHLLSQ